MLYSILTLKKKTILEGLPKINKRQNAIRSCSYKTSRFDFGD